MSIRVKLALFYFFTMGLALIILVVGGMAMTARIFHDIIYEVVEDNSVEQALTTAVDLLVDFKYASLHEPELFHDEAYMQGVENKLREYQAYPLVAEGGNIVYAAEGYGNLSIQLIEESMKQRDEIDYNISPSTNSTTNNRIVNSNSRSGSIVIDEVKYEVAGIAYQLTNGEPGSVYILINTERFNNIGRNYFHRLSNLFIGVIMVLMFALIFVISRMIIKPLLELERATINIRDGNLDRPLVAKKNDELGRVMKAFDKMRVELKKSIEIQLQYEENRKEFMTNISHDLKTPITSIKGYVEGIKDSVANTPEKLDKYLEVISVKANEMDKMIDDLFLFSKLDLSRVVYDLQDVDAYEYFEELTSGIQIEMDKEMITFSWEIQIEKMTMLTIDPQKTTRVLMNILQNSIKYMDKEEKRISLKVFNQEGFVGVSIEDNGRGIGKENLDFVFDRFYRCDPSRNTTIAGSGLGLSIAKQIITQQGGSIQAESMLGRGTKVTFYLKRK